MKIDSDYFIRKFNFILILIIAFSLPIFKSIISPLIILWLATWLAEGNFKKRFKIHNKVILILVVSFFLLHIAGLTYSKNSNESLFDIQVMLSLFIFPVTMIGVNDLYRNKTNYIFWGFISGNIVASLICLGHSFYLFFKWNAPFQYFTYKDLSILMHPSYFAMYLCFAIVILLSIYGGSNRMHEKTLCVFIVLFFSEMIYLLSSKAGLIVLAVIFIFFCFRLVQKVHNKIFSWLIRAIFLAILFSVITFNPRFEPLRDAGKNYFLSSDTIPAHESNSVRIKIIESSLEVIKQNFWFGVGNGDAKEELMHKYKLHNITMAEENKLNTHNQFLQTFIETGVIGFALLLLLFIIPFINSIKQKNILLSAFITLMFINFCFESMLETQAGTIFFGLFYSVLNFIPLKINEPRG